MRCRGMQYEVGKTYHVDGAIDVCKNGLHFCENLNDVFGFYERDGNRFFEVEATGAIKTDSKKSVTSDLVILRELTDVEINRSSYGNGTSYGCDYGDGYGDGYSCGYSNGYGYGYGDGLGCSYGYGNGSGYGYGDGDGNGNGDGYGYGYNNIQRIFLLV